MYEGQQTQFGRDSMAAKVAGMSYGSREGLMQQADTAIRKTEVEDEMNRLAITIEQAQTVLDVLTARLSPVLRATGANTAGDKHPGQPEPVLCTLADQIRGRRYGVEVVANQLQRLLGELEV